MMPQAATTALTGPGEITAMTATMETAVAGSMLAEETVAETVVGEAAETDCREARSRGSRRRISTNRGAPFHPCFTLTSSNLSFGPLVATSRTVPIPAA